jgi:hypothetical protein
LKPKNRINIAGILLRYQTDLMKGTVKRPPRRMAFI